MLVRYTVLKGKDAGGQSSIRLEPGERFTFGRGEECDLPLWDEAASRQHAALECTAEGLFVIDLDSSNGTRLDGQPVKRAEITGGERIGIGATEIRVELAGFQQRPTTIIRPDDELREDQLKVESSLSRDDVDLGARLAADKQHRSRLNLLLEFVEEAQSTEAGETILGKLLRTSVKALVAARGSVIPVAAHSREPLWQEALTEPTASRDLPLSRSVVRRVLGDGNAIQVSDVLSDPRTRSRESLVGRQIGSIVAAPVAGRERIHAVLYLERDQQAPGAPEEDLAYVATVGQIAGMALENAERLQRSRRILESRDRAQRDDIITENSELQATIELIGRFASSGGPVLIRGETGTGKELMARHAHRTGPYGGGPWIPVNCGAIPGTLLESELFGHEKGAFTGATGRKAGMFELAHEGTLFLDEIGDMPAELQAKLLRVLETGEFFRIGGRSPVSVRLLVVSATHRNLQELVQEDRFREDLFFRLNRFQVEIPPLRSRPEDIPLLSDHFLASAARRAGLELSFSTAAQRVLADYPWPGNVRELRNVIERAAVLARSEEVEPTDLVISPLATTTSSRCKDGPPPSLEEVEAGAIRRAMDYTGGKKGEAASLLGIAWPTLRRKLRKYGIED